MDPSTALVYQLKVILVGISPLIWRRLLVSGSHTITDLHYILQIAMGWSDDHLNRFTIHAKEYGVYHPGGILFSDDPETVKLADLQLREREKFGYKYDFTDRWQHQLRVETIHFLEHPLSAPVCIAGKRSAPPEDCGGPWDFQVKRQHYSVAYALEVLTDIYRGGTQTLQERLDEVRLLEQWLSLEQFDREAVNCRLQQYANGDRTELFAEVIR
ncbi:MAG TPA: plasmid pRiA4b ORF-3 family protein [Leptolyngbyaceae cyanobacterium]